jgi:hypothetical protein
MLKGVLAFVAADFTIASLSNAFLCVSRNQRSFGGWITASKRTL